MKKFFQTSRLKRFFARFFACLFLILNLSILIPQNSAFAIPNNTEQTTVSEQKTTETSTEKKDEKTAEEKKKEAENICSSQSGAIGWIICPGTGAIAKAIDAIYDVIDGFLVVDALKTDESSTIHIVWEAARDLTNIVFIIFLLVVVYSQLTGIGITNYGIKRVLPRIIIAALLVNLSYIICQVGVDASNILGYSLRGFFTSIQENAILNGAAPEEIITWTDLVNALTGSGLLAALGITITGGLGTFFWTVLPIIIGGLVSIIIGLATIAMRQALVALLIMISPLAFVCFLFPNTEVWFKKWKDLLIKMLVFYPVFSILYGASELAGWAIICSAGDDGFGVILGLAVQIFPLFFSWSLMKMSGTFLGAVNQRLHSLAARPMGAFQGYSAMNRELSKRKYLATKPKGLSQDIAQRIEDRQNRRILDTGAYAMQSKLRGQAYSMNYKNRKGHATRRGETFYALQQQSMDYQRAIESSKNDFEQGFGTIDGIAKNRVQQARLNRLDVQTIKSSDALKFELARGGKVQYDNAVGFYRRTEEAILANEDAEALRSGRRDHQYHESLNAGTTRQEALARYNTMRQIMSGNEADIQYIKADAAHGYSAQAKIVQSKFQTAYDLTPATQDVENQVRRLAKRTDSNLYTDQIISGLRVLNQRGDTDIVKHTIDDFISDSKVQLGTHASQSLANFLMFDVKDNDPFLRRYGKYINLETARVFNDGTSARKNNTLTFDEYIKGEYIEPDGSTGYSKLSVPVLMQGTSLDNVERTFYRNVDESLRKAYADEDGNLSGENVEAFKKKRKEIANAMGAAFISAALKYPSGSEQLVNQVSFLTGYKEKKGKLVKRWEDPEDALYGLDEEFFRANSEKYITDQTPSQILSLRSDFKKSLGQHLFDSYMSDPEHMTDYDSKVASINSDTSLTDDEKKSQIEALRTSKISARLTELLDQNGALPQLYRTRRSGAANNAKKFVREWLQLDNESDILRYLKEKGAAEKRERHRSDSSDSSSPDTPTEIYTATDRTYYAGKAAEIFTDSHDDKATFNDSVIEFLEVEGLDSILHSYNSYNRSNPSADTATLYDELKSLLEDPSSYI